jgi:hypothetical protein
MCGASVITSGLTCFGRPDLWLGRDENNQLFFETDAPINSWHGLVLPLSLAFPALRSAAAGSGAT